MSFLIEYDLNENYSKNCDQIFWTEYAIVNLRFKSFILTRFSLIEYRGIWYIFN